MPTGNEVRMYDDIHRIALALEQIAKTLKDAQPPKEEA